MEAIAEKRFNMRWTPRCVYMSNPSSKPALPAKSHGPAKVLGSRYASGVHQLRNETPTEGLRCRGGRARTVSVLQVRANHGRGNRAPARPHGGDDAAAVLRPLG